MKTLSVAILGSVLMRKIVISNYIGLFLLFFSSLIEQHEDIDEHFCMAFCCRVLRASIPLQLMLLLLLGLAALVPMSEDDYSCLLANNFRRSLEMMLQYTDGPPPV